MNPFVIAFLGFSHEQFLGKKIWEIGLFKDVVANKDNFEELQRKESIRYENLPLETADGRQINVEFVSNVYMVNDKKVIQCNIRDITERKRVEVERARLAAIEEYSEDAIIAKTMDGIITNWNNSAERIYGYSAQEMVGQNISRLDPPAQIDDTRLIIERIRNGEPVIRYETMRRKKDGGLINVSLTASRIRNARNDLIGITTIAHDITKRKQAEVALRETTEYLNNLFNYANAPIIVWDPEFRITRFNHAFEYLTGRMERDVLGHSLDILFPAESRDVSRALIKKTLEGEHWETVEIPILTKDGSIQTALWNSANILSEDGKIISTIAQGVDITERKKLADLIKVSLAEKETLLREIHHRVKNNLQIVSSMLNMQIRKITDPQTIETLRDSQNRVMSMALVHEHLYRGKDFAHIDLKNYITALGKGLFQTYADTNSGVRFDIAIREIYVDINAAIPLGLISNELITNSLKYAFKGKKGGILSITATEDPQYLTFIVADNGVGMPKGITLENQDSLGLRLVHTLTGQPPRHGDD